MNRCFYTTGFCQALNTSFLLQLCRRVFPLFSFFFACSLIQMTWMLVSNRTYILNDVVYIDKESTSAGLYGGIVPVVDTCTIPYAHVLYMGCGKGRYVNGVPMYKDIGRGWGGIGTLEHIDYGRLWMD